MRLPLPVPRLPVPCALDAPHVAADRAAPVSRRVALGRVARLALGGALGAATGGVAAQTLTEAQAKAAFILNFARYVEWPASAFGAKDAPVVAAVLAREAIATALGALDGRPVQGRTLKARRIASLDEARGCHVVFLGDADERRLAQQLKALAGQPVLTIGDADRFLDLGGAIGLVPADDRLQFEISRTALDQQQLKAGANLLRLARNHP